MERGVVCHPRRRDSKTKNGSDNNLKISFFIFFVSWGVLFRAGEFFDKTV